MSHDLAARLDQRAVEMEKSAKDWQSGSVYQQALPNHQVAKAFESFAERDTHHAADLRAAAAAVRAMEQYRIVAEEMAFYVERYGDRRKDQGYLDTANKAIELVSAWQAALPAPPEATQ